MKVPKYIIKHGKGDSPVLYILYFYNLPDPNALGFLDL